MLLPFWFPKSSFSPLWPYFSEQKWARLFSDRLFFAGSIIVWLCFLGGGGGKGEENSSSPPPFFSSLSVVLGHCINSKQSRLSSAKKKHGIIGGCYPMTYPKGGGGGEQRTERSGRSRRLRGSKRKKNASGAVALLLYPVLYTALCNNMPWTV